MAVSDIERLAELVARLPGLGPRSARRAVLHLLNRREGLMLPLAAALQRAAENVRACTTCGNLDTIDPCYICRDPGRDGTVICVVEEIGDLWAIERTKSFRGQYHVLGGTLSALDGRGPEQLNIARLVTRAHEANVSEVILALSATVDGQTTAHYVVECLAGLGIAVSRLAQGVPFGGELDYLDDGTLTAALTARRPA